ncbi:acyl-CoA-binding domain-containing protein 4 [Ascaphus truei]|uniref:acyl-CoA-binding domain-containing protein 4 n=1 Tax=Ascaphus truei TaxID=8439 RepID=UPI003F59B063
MGTDQDEMGHQRQFNAAVTVIQGLPKNGSYRPSYEEMLRFYSYYKQATAGPCTIPRPGFWDPIGRYKWDAWSRLGGMSRQDAMRSYIKQMKMVAQKIIDTVPLKETSPEMFEPFRPLYEVIPDMPRPPDSFFGGENEEKPSRETEDGRQSQEEGIEEPRVPGIDVPGCQRRGVAESDPQPGQEGGDRQRGPVGLCVWACLLFYHLSPCPRSLFSGGDAFPGEGSRGQRWEPELEDFCDTVEQLQPEKDSEDPKYSADDSWIRPHIFQPVPDTRTVSTTPDRRQGGGVCLEHDTETVLQSASDPWQGHISGACSTDSTRGSQSGMGSPQPQLGPQIRATVQALQASIQGLCHRLENLEKALQDLQPMERPHRPSKLTKPWLCLPIPSRTLLLLLIWPFIVHWLLRKSFSRKR